MENPIIGAEIVSEKNQTGIVIDKAHPYHGESTRYICMTKDGTIFIIGYSEVKEIKRFISHPESDYSKYLQNEQ